MISNLREASEVGVPYYTTDGLNGVMANYVGKFKFGEDIDWNLVDSLRYFETDILFNEEVYHAQDKIKSAGFILETDISQTIMHDPFRIDDYGLAPFFPFYLVNPTQDTLFFQGKNGSAYAIQEAIDPSDRLQWHPIEYRAFDFCGVGRWGISVFPQEYLMFLLPKYNGDVRTDSRVVCSVGNGNIIKSASYPSYISTDQFEARGRDKELLQENQFRDLHYYFLGCFPKGLCFE